MDNNTLAKFLPNQYYHVYNRTNNKEDLFLSENNRFYFLDLVKTKLSGFVSLLAFSLMNNHFHLCIKVNSVEEIIAHINRLPIAKRSKKMMQFIDNQDNMILFNEVFTYLFSGLFSSYSQSFNHRHSRKGNLFYRPFKRSLLESETKIKYIFYYIHHNARKHDVVSEFKDHEWNSYHLIVINEEDLIDIQSVLEVFENLEEFKAYHDEFLLPKDQL